MEVSEYVEKFKSELETVVRFWASHSHDEKHGGFYSMLSESGEVYDTTKYSWMGARQVWMYAKLYNTMIKYHSMEILQPAIEGGEFLMRHVATMDTTAAARCYFATTEDGKPCKLQRKPYTECFYIMALAELYKATQEQKYQMASETALSQLIYWIRVDDSDLGVPRLSGVAPCQELGRPMMLLNVLTEFCGSDEQLRKKYAEDFDWAVAAILKHSDGEVVREYIAPDGSSLPGCQGRQLTPGHALEAGWFLLEEARVRNDETLTRVAIEQFIDRPNAYGTDPMHGGLFYFLDREGRSPLQLEWSMKLWWVHCEAMLALIMAYRATRERRHWQAFTQMCQLCFTKFSDAVHGEWYGYLTRDWQLNQTFKGGPYKGCFHVPRALLYCLQALEQIQLESAAAQ